MIFLPIVVIVESGEINPEWKWVDLSSYSELQNLTSDFWIFAEYHAESELRLMGDVAHDPPSHSFKFEDGSWIGPVDCDYMIRAKVTWDVNEKGDVTSDGAIDIIDVIRVVNIILGIHTPDEDELCRADVTYDGEVNILDVVGIVNKILGIGPTNSVIGS